MKQNLTYVYLALFWSQETWGMVGSWWFHATNIVKQLQHKDFVMTRSDCQYYYYTWGKNTSLMVMTGHWSMFSILLHKFFWPRICWIHYCHDCDTRSTLYHSVQSRPCIYCPFHCMYLWFAIISILFVSPPIRECFVRSVFPYDYLMCFHLRFRLLTVPVLSYLLIWYASGNWPQTSPSLLIVLRELHSSTACPTPRALPHTFYSSI